MRLRADVVALSTDIGERNTVRSAALSRAEAWISDSLVGMGHTVARQPYSVHGIEVANLVATLPGTGSDLVVVGAHYDSAQGTPGADDNASGMAVLLELARRLAGRSFARTVMLVAWVNEEPPFFQTTIPRWSTSSATRWGSPTTASPGMASAPPSACPMGTS